MAVFVFVEDGNGLGYERDTDSLGTCFPRLDGYVFKVSVVDVVPGE